MAKVSKKENKKQKLAKTKSGMAKAYEPKLVEDTIYQLWNKSGFFNPDKLPGKRKKPFTVIMPPPNATGTLHVGHALFLSLQDIMIRFERLRGKTTLWLPGTDHAAIATHAKVESIIAKEEGKTRFDLGREEFLKRIDVFVEQSQSRIREQIRKMGSSCDWSREAYTLDKKRSAAVKECFVKMWKDGLVYRGYRVVNWSVKGQSTCSDDEVEYIEQKTKLYTFKYAPDFPIAIATTRPETKLGDTAVAVHPTDLRYKKYIGQKFTVDVDAEKPLVITIIADKNIDPKFGTGALGVTPAHSPVDFEMYQQNKSIGLIQVIGMDGKITKAGGASYEGLAVLEAREKFVTWLREKQLLIAEEDLVHNVGISDRFGDIIEPLPSRQWFVNVNAKIPGRKKSLKELSVEVVRKGDIEIVPDRFEKVYFNWMNNLRDWCISRQIWFGHRIPVWYCQDCFSDESKNSEGLIVSITTPKKCPTCKGTNLIQDPDTLDTWFSSGMWTFSTLGWPKTAKDLKKFHPTQVLETGYDILFFWVARMILMTTYVLQEIPFEKVYLHGLIRDENGQKMSKSLGNIIDPLDVAEKYGTDAVRLSVVIGNSPGNDLKLSESKIEYFRNFANKMWNIARYVAMNAKSVKNIKTPKAKSLADQWILSRLNQVIKLVGDDLEVLQFSRAGETLRDFTWNEFADWYIEVSKVEVKKDEILLYVLRNILILWHPFMPFVTEAIYLEMFSKNKKDLLMVASWPQSKSIKNGKKILKDFSLIMEIITAIRQIRTNYNIPPGKLLSAVIVSKQVKLLKENQTLVMSLARLENLEIFSKSNQVENSASAIINGAQVFVSLSGVVDMEAEKLKVQKAIEETESYLSSLEKKLSNADFVARAPKTVVDVEKAKKQSAEEKLAKLQEDLKKLG